MSTVQDCRSKDAEMADLDVFWRHAKAMNVDDAEVRSQPACGKISGLVVGHACARNGRYVDRSFSPVWRSGTTERYGADDPLRCPKCPSDAKRVAVNPNKRVDIRHFPSRSHKQNGR